MKVTAIISAYYAEKYLERKIENLLSQSLIPQIMVVAKRCPRYSRQLQTPRVGLPVSAGVIRSHLRRQRPLGRSSASAGLQPPRHSGLS